MRVITLEEHITTPMHKDASFDAVRQTWYAARSAHVGHDIERELLDVGSSRLASMDATGISLQVLSLTTPGCQAFAGDQAISMARDANDRMAAAVAAHPDRFRAFAALPTADIRAALTEFESPPRPRIRRGDDQWAHVGALPRRQSLVAVAGHGAVARRSHLRASRRATPRADGKLLQGLRGPGATGMGIRDGCEYAFPANAIWGRLRRVPALADHSGTHGRRVCPSASNGWRITRPMSLAAVA